MLIAGVLLSLCLITMAGAEIYDRHTTRIRLGADMGRPTNGLDCVWVPSGVLAFAFFSSALLFLRKGD